MIVIPAIDIRGGQCVRLHQGDYARETVYGADPVEMALRWEAEGAERLHVVDLDGARDGTGANREIVARIAQAVRIPVQTGGGLRNAGAIAWMLDRGIERCVVGTTAALDRDLAATLFREFGDSVILGLDARDGRVAVKGWREVLDLEAVPFALDMVALGARRIIYTDIACDGTLEGPNLEAMAAMARAAGVPVIASGGVSRAEDIAALAALPPPGVEWVITGKALYAGTLTLSEALKAASRAGSEG
jgi:phosphoribosylformimino-5-aminoimidazole carboxamide ribotide isomerase